jgi:hypothetical protein
MKKSLFLVLALVTFASLPSFAQDGRFSAGLEIGLPTGDFGDAVGVGIGITGRYESAINNNLTWMATLGFVSFTEKDDSGLKASIIPIQGGLKYYFNNSFDGFYAGAELGLNIVKVKYDGGPFNDGGSDSDTELGFAPQIGYHLANVDVSLRYQIVDDLDYFGIRAAYVFNKK